MLRGGLASPHAFRSWRAPRPIYVSNGVTPGKKGAFASPVPGSDPVSASGSAVGGGAGGGAGPSLEWTWSKLKGVINTTSIQESALMEYSAACLYFGLGLADKMAAEGESVRSILPTKTHKARGAKTRSLFFSETFELLGEQVPRV